MSCKPYKKSGKPRKKSWEKGVIIAAVIVVVLLTAAGIVCSLYFTSDSYWCKNKMKQAQKCLEEGKDWAAIDYYRNILKIDETYVEAYISSADIYLADKKYEPAISVLSDGIENTQDETLKQKRMEAYQAGIAFFLSNEDYDMALAVLNDAVDTTGDSAMTKQRVQT